MFIRWRYNWIGEITDSNLSGDIQCFDFIDGISKLLKQKQFSKIPTNRAHSEPYTYVSEPEPLPISKTKNDQYKNK